MKLFTPFEKLSQKSTYLIILGWFILIVGYWSFTSSGESHIFPSIGQVLTGFSTLWNEGLMTHIFSSIALCAKAILIAVAIALSFTYLAPLPIMKPMSNFISKFRYLPLTGIAFYINVLVNDGRAIQIWVLVTFIVTYLTTSLLSMLKDIPQEEFDHARTLGCNRWEVLWEVVIKGRLDYVVELIRQNLAIAWMMLVTVETMMAASGGLGLLIKNSDKFASHGRIVALQLIILAVGLFMDYSLNLTRKICFRYSKI